LVTEASISFQELLAGSQAVWDIQFVSLLDANRPLSNRRQAKPFRIGLNIDWRIRIDRDDDSAAYFELGGATRSILGLQEVRA
jgi:hypothetical protein